MESVKVSIVVPVYNTERYLENCLNSLVSQTFKNYEVILVDDGSKDDSLRICESFSAKYDFIHVIHTSNQGVTKARKTGVEAADGEWVSFVDSDDIIAPEYLETLYSVSDTTDIVVNVNPSVYKQLCGISMVEARKELLKVGKIATGPVCKLFRRRLFNSSVFNIPREITLGEDMIMNIRLFFSTEKAPHFVFGRIYQYLVHNNSLSTSTVSSLSFEALVDKYRVESIPSEIRSTYMRALTEGRIDGLFHSAKTDPHGYLRYRKNSYVSMVIEDAKACGYRMSLDEYSLIHRTGVFFYLGIKLNTAKKIIRKIYRGY